MAATKIKPAFPGRASAMGYEPGLTKLEYMVTLLAANLHLKKIDEDGQVDLFTDEQAIAACVHMAKAIIEACEKAEESN